MSNLSTAAPTFDLVVGRPNIMNKSKFLDRVSELLEAKAFTNNGKFVQELEQKVRDHLDVPHCVSVANATLGLEVLLTVLGIKGEVIVPSFTFVASAHAIVRVGAKPVFADIDKTSCLLDLEKTERLINDKTSAIMAVNVYGNLIDPDRLQALADRYNLKVIYDSAHTLGCKWNGRYSGSYGDAEVFSLHATKFINGFEGGLITTSNSETAKACELYRNFGFTGYDQVSGVGTNAKLSEIHAAMALTNFEHIDEIITVNRSNYASYQKYLPNWAELLSFAPGVESNYQYVVVILPSGSRQKICDALLQQRVFARKYFYPGIHKFAPYSEQQWNLPITEDLAERVICLPTGQDVSEESIQMICKILENSHTEI